MAPECTKRGNTSREALFPLVFPGVPRSAASIVRHLLDQSLMSWEAGIVTQAARKLLEEFDALPDQERSEVLAELARRVGLSPHSLPDDDDLITAADRLFIELDQREPGE
jgi:hypothetical protein